MNVRALYLLQQELVNVERELFQQANAQLVNVAPVPRFWVFLLFLVHVVVVSMPEAILAKFLGAATMNIFMNALKQSPIVAAMEFRKGAKHAMTEIKTMVTVAPAVAQSVQTIPIACLLPTRARVLCAMPVFVKRRK